MAEEVDDRRVERLVGLKIEAGGVRNVGRWISVLGLVSVLLGLWGFAETRGTIDSDAGWVYLYSGIASGAFWGAIAVALRLFASWVANWVDERFE